MQHKHNICARLSNETNELVAEWNHTDKREREKEEEEDLSQPKTCAHLIVTSISSKQTYREVSAVCASKKPGGNAWRELSITLRVVFESNINVFVTKKMQSSETIVSLGDSMHRCQYNEIPPLFPFHFIPPPRIRLKVRRARLQL